jgi:hypothetical protein
MKQEKINIYLGVKKLKKAFRAQNQYFRVIYPPMQNFAWSKKKNIHLGVKKRK